jgi:hypothetical protein
VVDSKFHTEDSGILKDAEKSRRQSDLAPVMFASLKDITGQLLRQNFNDIKEEIKIVGKTGFAVMLQNGNGRERKHVCTAVL